MAGDYYFARARLFIAGKYFGVLYCFRISFYISLVLCLPTLINLLDASVVFDYLEVRAAEQPLHCFLSSKPWTLQALLQEG